MALTKAQEIAWELYRRRLGDTLTEQLGAFERGHPSITMMMRVPDQGQVQVIEKALFTTAVEARKEVFSMAIEPLRIACDAIDNSHSKSETVKAIRKDIEKTYQALLKMFQSPEAVAANHTTSDVGDAS